ncbi:MAG: aldo/keto reductase [Bacteroidales bacterium]|nr:aldo/keto reductase [Bacteroidales bacterium]
MNNYTPDENRYQKMKYRRCGESGIVLPEISFGLWQNFGSQANLDNCTEMIRYAFDNGITHFDLANNYGPPAGNAEEMFGYILRKNPLIKREEIIISTKAGHEMWTGPYGDGSSRKMLFTSLNQSLKRMGLDYVDIFYSHRYDGITPIEETMQALVDIVRSGKALYVGISKYPAKEAQYAYDYLKHRDVRCLIYQGRYNMFNREPENEIIDLANKNGAGFIAFSPLAQGILTDKYINGIPANSRMSRDGFLKKEILTYALVGKIRDLNAIAAKREQSLAQMALCWTLRDPEVTSVIAGASSLNQLRDNIKSVENTSFGKEELQIIDSILKE